MTEEHPVVIAGSGVAGLSAAYRLHQEGDVPFIVYEKQARIGGNSRTARFGEFRFDLGGHRFYTKKAHIDSLVRELVGEDLLVVDRLSRILFKSRFVNYPLSAFNTLKVLGPVGATRAVFDYICMKCRNLVTADQSEDTFEQWALNRFGRYLYEVYFKLYTEKTWGVACTELSADFAEQRIQGLSFREAAKDAILKKGKDESLVRQFIYPRYGFGQIPRAMATEIGGPRRIQTRRPVVGVEHEDERVTAVLVRRPDGSTRRQACSELISSTSIDRLVRMLRPAPPEKVLDAADALTYRNVMILFLVLDVEQVSPDHWIYVPAPEIDFCRLHEPKNWSPEMAPADRTSLVVEYFCQSDDACWNAAPEELAAAAGRDLARTGLIEPDWVSDFTAVPLPRAYPVYRLGYERHLECITEYLSRFSNLHRAGRNACFVYTSSDHYIDMGLKAAENVLGHDHDVSKIGTAPRYAETWHEEDR